VNPEHFGGVGDRYGDAFSHRHGPPLAADDRSGRAPQVFPWLVGNPFSEGAAVLHAGFGTRQP
jgi:hypothetical protein